MPRLSIRESGRGCYRFYHEQTNPRPPAHRLSSGRRGETSAAADGRATVLIADNDIGDIILLGEILRPDHHVLIAKSGDDALGLAHAEQVPDIVLLSSAIPGMNSYDVLARLRESRRTRTVPVIIIVPIYLTGSEEHGLALGAVDFIIKPIASPALVRARILTQIELKRMRDILREGRRGPAT